MAFAGSITKNEGSAANGHANSWEGESPNPQDPDRPYQNHDSDQEWSEVRRLTEQGINLLILNAASVQRLQGNQLLKAALAKLSHQGHPSPIVRVDKGIHQRGTAPHITAKVMGCDGSLHIWLSAKDAKTAAGGSDFVKSFAWQAVAVSAEEYGARVPAVVVVRGVRRRGSITQAQLTVLENKKQAIRKARQERASALERQADAALKAISGLFV
jgi:hypothetical protein